MLESQEVKELKMNKIKFCILDVYPNDNFRICKDTAGGYGTGNNFGNSILSKILNVFTLALMYIKNIFS